jgi:CheY-like chemotaxis protein
VAPHAVDPGSYVKISITDTGVGMDETTRRRIFDPFFTTKGIGRGTGLGLASSYGIIKNHDGFINAYSEPGRGSTFSIYLPATEQPAVTAEEKQARILEGTETILIVDDEKRVLDVGSQMLTKLGYTVMTAGSGAEAIDIYRSHGAAIQLVILDMIMPGMSGSETFDHLKRIDAEIRVLLSSGYSINGDATAILKKGCRGFVQKPFSLARLSQKVHEVLT